MFHEVTIVGACTYIGELSPSSGPVTGILPRVVRIGLDWSPIAMTVDLKIIYSGFRISVDHVAPTSH